MVGEFMEKAHKKHHPSMPNPFLCWDMFKEEFRELHDAYIDYIVDDSKENREMLAKEWADCQVTLSNIAWFFSLNGEEAFKRVHENNMTKLTDGELKRRDDGKVLKPDGYKPPNMKGL